MSEYELKLAEEEVNQILFLLSKQPYEQVFELIEKIREQAIKQGTSNLSNRDGFFADNKDTGV